MSSTPRPWILALAAGLLLGLGTPGAASAQSEQMREDIRTFLTISGGISAGDVMIDGMIQSLRPMAPQVPDSFWQEFRAEVDLNEFTELLVPIYAERFTHQEIRDMIAFYQTPTGRKLASISPELTQAGMLAGQQWGAQLAQRVMQRLQTYEAQKTE